MKHSFLKKIGTLAIVLTLTLAAAFTSQASVAPAGRSEDYWLNGTFYRNFGPKSCFTIYSMDKKKFIFSFGVEGFMDYRDIQATWTDDSTSYATAYVNGYQFDLSFEDNGTITIYEGNGIMDDISIRGTYIQSLSGHLDNDCERVFGESSTKYLDLSSYDRDTLSATECKIARNEIYAVHGRKFTDSQLQKYFDDCLWYRGTTEASQFSTNCLNKYEKANIKEIEVYEKRCGYR